MHQQEIANILQHNVSSPCTDGLAHAICFSGR